MKNRRLFAYGLLTGALLSGIGFAISQSLISPILRKTRLSPEEQILGSVHRHLAHQYVEFKDPQEIMRHAVQGMAEGMNDPYTQFLGPESLSKFEEEASGTLIGIGVTLSESGEVYYPFPGGPAELAGIEPGDKILSINGIPITEISPSERSKAIKGPQGTKVSLLLQRRDKSKFKANLKRSPIPTKTIGKIDLIDKENGIGNILIRSFSKKTPTELDEALESLMSQGMKALILDLRFNTGGLLDAAVSVAGRFVRGGVICTLIGRNGDRKVKKANPSNFIGVKIPVTILINEFSASGSEVVASALRDRGVAVLVGSKSFGKGVFQKVQQYPTGNFVLKYTAGYFVTPAGRILEGHISKNTAGGLEPDVVIPKEKRLGALRSSLSLDLPPEKYRKKMKELFPHYPSKSEPKDLAKTTALKLLRLSLQPLPPQ